MRLYLAQHAAAYAKADDPERPLTPEGRHDAERMAAFLGDAGVQATRVLHSGKLRAAQTAEQLADRLAPGVEPEVSELLAPDAEPGPFDWQLGAWDADALVVGHQPFVGRLVAHLVTGDPERAAVAYQPGSVVCLERVGTDQWGIAWMVRPELLA